jgi:hypothetical protein
MGFQWDFSPSLSPVFIRTYVSRAKNSIGFLVKCGYFSTREAFGKD